MKNRPIGPGTCPNKIEEEEMPVKNWHTGDTPDIPFFIFFVVMANHS